MRDLTLGVLTGLLLGLPIGYLLCVKHVADSLQVPTTQTHQQSQIDWRKVL
jgi:hypothetical protein